MEIGSIRMTNKLDIEDHFKEDKEELIKKLKEDPHLALEGKAREAMIQGFLEKGIKDKKLDKLVSNYFKAVMIKEGDIYKLEGLMMGRMNQLLIHEAKKQRDPKKQIKTEKQKKVKKNVTSTTSVDNKLKE